jgi:signal transduction histidine kinase
LTKFQVFLFCLIVLFQSCRKQDEPKTFPKIYPQKTPPPTDFQAKLYFKQFTSKDGLPSTQIWNIYQDRFGYMWVATSEGIARFDGYQIYPYYDNIQQGVRLKAASNFFESKDGTLWVLNGAGFLNKFIRNEDRFEAIKTPFENGWSEQSTHTILEDSLNNFWIGAYGGLQYWDRNRDTILTYPIQRIRDQSWAHEEKLRFGKMYADKRGNIWIGTRKFGFVKFNIATKSYHCYRFDKENKDQWLSNWITDFVPLEDGTLLISDWDYGSLVHFDTKTEKILKTIKIEGLKVYPKAAYIRDIYDEGNQVFALCTNNDGVVIYDFKTNKVINQYIVGADKNTSISGNSVRCIAKDRLGNYWMGSETLEMASPKLYTFTDFFADANQADNLRNDKIYSLASTQDNKLIVSTNDGLSIYDEKTQKFDNSYNFNKKNLQTFAVLEERDGTSWVSYGDKIIHFNPKNKQIIKEYLCEMPVDKENINNLKLACRMMQDSRDNIWTINYWGRLNKIDKKRNEVSQIVELSQDETKQKFVNILGMIDDPSHQRIVVASDNGLATVDYLENKVVRKSLKINGLDLSKANISYIYKGEGGDVWLLIEGKPYRLNLDNFDLEELKLSEAYNVDGFKWIVESPKGTLWLSCFRGIIKYDILDKTSSIYFTPNVGENNLDYTSPVATLNGNLYFSGVKGLTMLEPTKIATKQGETNTLIEYLKIPLQKNNNIDSTLFVFDKNEVELDYFQNKFSIKYVGLRFHHVSEIKYAYKLEGYDTDWISADTKQEATYTNLSPKTYIFHVKSLDNPSNVAHLKIIIRPPFWLNWWAILFYLLVISGLIYWFTQFRIKQKLKKIKELEAIRIRISSNLHDDVGTILSGLAMQSEMLALTTNKEQKDVLLEIRDMSHEAMERMRDTVWAIDSRKDKFENLIDRMRAYTEKNLNLKNIKHNFSIEVEDLKAFINPEVRQNLYLILKEAITNICKHSDATLVNVVFRHQKNQYFLEITDNGKIKPTVNSDGTGLHNMMMRANKINAKLNIEKSDGYRVWVEM